MFPYEFYKVMHLVGILLLFTSLGGVAMLALRGGSDEEKKPLKKMLMIAHGFAMVIILVAGFGLMARLGMMGSGWPGWVFGKLAVWVVLGGAAALIAKKPAMGKSWYVLLPVLGGIAAWLAVFKPFK